MVWVGSRDRHPMSRGPAGFGHVPTSLAARPSSFIDPRPRRGDRRGLRWRSRWSACSRSHRWARAAGLSCWCIGAPRMPVPLDRTPDALLPSLRHTGRAVARGVAREVGGVGGRPRGVEAHHRRMAHGGRPPRHRAWRARVVRPRGPARGARAPRARLCRRSVRLYAHGVGVGVGVGEEPSSRARGARMRRGARRAHASTSLRPSSARSAPASAAALTLALAARRFAPCARGAPCEDATVRHEKA